MIDVHHANGIVWEPVYEDEAHPAVFKNRVDAGVASSTASDASKRALFDTSKNMRRRRVRSPSR